MKYKYLCTFWIEWPYALLCWERLEPSCLYPQSLLLYKSPNARIKEVSKIDLFFKRLFWWQCYQGWCVATDHPHAFQGHRWLDNNCHVIPPDARLSDINQKLMEHPGFFDNMPTSEYFVMNFNAILWQWRIEFLTLEEEVFRFRNSLGLKRWVRSFFSVMVIIDFTFSIHV